MMGCEDLTYFHTLIYSSLRFSGEDFSATVVPAFFWGSASEVSADDCNDKEPHSSSTSHCDARLRGYWSTADFIEFIEFVNWPYAT